MQDCTCHRFRYSSLTGFSGYAASLSSRIPCTWEAPSILFYVLKPAGTFKTFTQQHVTRSLSLSYEPLSISDRRPAMFENKLAQAYEAFTQFCVDHHLASLPLHAHQVVGAFFAYEAIFLVVSPTLSRIFFPSTYNQLRKRTKVNWDVRVVSFIQSTFICTRAIKIILKRQSDASTYDTRLWAYSNASGNVQAYAAGYFLWDLLVSAQYLGALGPGSLTHACAALLITTLGFVSEDDRLFHYPCPFF